MKSKIKSRREQRLAERVMSQQASEKEDQHASRSPLWHTTRAREAEPSGAPHPGRALDRGAADLFLGNCF
jgi:hypothetical protein